MNYFEVLGISLDADDRELKQGYRKLALKHHPDKSQASSEAFQKIHEAYLALKNPETRQVLSEKLKKQQALSEKQRKLREELLKREETGITKLPQKRNLAHQREQQVVQKKSWVKVEWNSSKVYTEGMIRQGFQPFGEILKIRVDGLRAFLEFGNEMASDRAIARPPIFFKVSRVQEKELLEAAQEEKSKMDIKEKLEILRKRLKKDEN